jgi:hypothetical protein
VHPDEACLLVSNSPVKQPKAMDSAPRRDRAQSPVRDQDKTNHTSHPLGQQGRGKSAPPIPMESALLPGPHSIPHPGQLDDPGRTLTTDNSANDSRRHVQNVRDAHPQSHGDQANGAEHRNSHGPAQTRLIAGADGVQNGDRQPTPPPTGFVNSRAAEILNTENRGGQLPDVPVFNPHVSGNIPRTKGIDHTKSAPITRQIVTKGANGMATGTPPRMNFVNPQADTNRKIGMPMSGVPSPLSNRSAYKPPRPAGLKRGPEGPPRPPLADVSNVQLNGAGDVDPKRQRVGDGATEGHATVLPENRTNG